ncbi:MAG TPA: CoA activase, partial [Thermosynergistes sp.]|nr:CoA activase [Thermosynergistes sp.]
LDFEVPAPLKGFFKQSRALIQVFNAIKMNDMLDDLVRRFRPYCRDKAAFDRLYEKEIVELERLIEEKGASVGTLKEWSRKASRRFAALTTDAHERFPLVLYVGEIYTRQHDPYANNVIRRLEEEGLEVIRGSISEWIEYVNYTTHRENPHWIHKVADLYLSFADWRFHRLFGGTNGERKVLPKPEQIIEGVEAAGIYHGDITGESPLVIGIFRELMEGRLPSKNGAKVCGIFHVGPFTCMQEGVAMAKMDAMLKEAQKKNPNLMVPVIHAFFGDSANPNLEAEIAAFREQCYLKARLV